MFSFKNKVVWITGSTTGIGKAMAIAFAEHGTDVVIHNYDNKEEASLLLSHLTQMGVSTLLVEGDVTDKQQVNNMVSQIQSKFNRLSILINNVGASPGKAPFENLDEEVWDRIIDINLKSMYYVTQASLPLLKLEGKGKIINLCSTTARTGGAQGGIAYATSKGGVKTLTRGLAKELAQYNILVNAIAPGLVDTPIHGIKIQDKYSERIQRIPLQRVGYPEDIAGTALFLASDYSDYITGEIIEVSGGSRLV